MGCYFSRGDLSIEENIIIQGEHTLGYYSKNCNEVSLLHKKYSFNSKINNIQFNEIASQLNLPVISSPTPKIIEFYKKFRVNDAFYSMNLLLMLGVLLSCGLPMDKAKMFFEIEDKTNLNVLKRSNVKALVKGIITISTE